MATLKKLVDETTNIKDELVTCHTNLKNNLITKGVECSDADKLLSLVNKVGETSMAIVESSDNVLMELGSLANYVAVQVPPNSIKKQFTFTSTFKGSVRFLVVFNNSTGNVDGVFLKNDLIMKTITGGLNKNTMSFDFSDVNKGDILSFGFKNKITNADRVVNVSKWEIRGDLIGI